jgi:hypothetical protein
MYKGGLELLGPYYPISWDGYSRLPSHQWWVRTLNSNCHVMPYKKDFDVDVYLSYRATEWLIVFSAVTADEKLRNNFFFLMTTLKDALLLFC